MNPR